MEIYQETYQETPIFLEIIFHYKLNTAPSTGSKGNLTFHPIERKGDIAQINKPSDLADGHNTLLRNTLQPTLATLKKLRR